MTDKLGNEWKVSIRRSCSAFRIDRSLHVYKSKRNDQAALKQRIKDICKTRVRYGYRRVHVLLQRDGWAANIKRVYRLYRELGLQLRNKTPKRRVKAKLREGRTSALQINETWAELAAGSAGQSPVDRQRRGWTLFMTSSPPAARSVCSQS